MKVRDMIEILERCNPNSDLILEHQESWPFECSIDKVISREDTELSEAQQILSGGERTDILCWLKENVCCSGDPEVVKHEREELDDFETDQLINIMKEAIQAEAETQKESSAGDSWMNHGKPDDVIIIMGSQLRYGTKSDWDKEPL